MMWILVALLFWSLLALLLYAWCLFPVLLHGYASLRRYAQSQNDDTSNQNSFALPVIMVVIAAWNEEASIAARIHNLLDTDYPLAQLHILIGTDGCTDHTAACARQAACAHADTAAAIEIHTYAHKRGKAAVLKDLVQIADTYGPATNALIVFSDANTFFRTDTLARLARHFSDPRIGGVCGRLQFFAGQNVAEHAYWNLETSMKHDESALDSCLGANGAVYAIRPILFWHSLPDEAIIDDFVIGMKVREAGFILRYDPDAVAQEKLPDVDDEWRRRVRIGSGAYQALRWCRACLHPRFGAFAWCFWSHKVLRWFTPHIVVLCGALALSICLQADPYARTLTSLLATGFLVALALGLAAAASSYLWRHAVPGQEAHRSPLQAFLLHIEHLVVMQVALLTGFFRFCRGNLAGSWTRTPRKNKWTP